MGLQIYKKIIFLNVIIGLSLFTMGNGLFAQQQIQINPINFDHVTNSEGLMHNSIDPIFQDSRGYMWLGTVNGLYKYGGSKYKIYNNELGNQYSIIGNRITAIIEDSEGVLWIGTSSGLCRYNRDTDTFSRELTNAQSNSSFIFKHNVNAIFEDDSKTLWVGTSDGLHRLDRSSNGFTLSVYRADSNGVGLSNNYVTQILQDDLGLLIGTRKGLNRIPFKDGSELEIKKILHNDLVDLFVSSMIIDFNSTVWIGTNTGLHKIVYSSGNNFEVSKNVLATIDNSLSSVSINSLLRYDKSNIWVGTKKLGLLNLNLVNNKATFFQHDIVDAQSLRSNEINVISKDNSGLIWIGTARGGVSKLDMQRNRIEHIKNHVIDPLSLSGNVVNSIYEDSQKNIWIGTFGNGLNVFTDQQKDNRVTRIDSRLVGSDNVHAICEDNYGNIWLGTMSNGITQIKFFNGKIVKAARFTKENTNSILESNKLHLMYKDVRGDIWIGGDSNLGLLRLKPNKEFGELPLISQYKRIQGNTNSLTENHVSAIYEDSQGILWVGTRNNGLVKILRDVNNNPIDYIRIRGRENNPSGLNNNQIFAIHEDTDSNLWIATFGGGLNKIPREQKNKRFPEIIKFKKEQGLPSNEIYGILEGNNNDLWISTNNGISNYDKTEDKFSNLGTSDGLQALNFRKNAFFKAKDGTMYFGGINGFNKFNPDGFQKNTTPPKIEIVGFKVFNKDVEINEEILGKAILEKEISETDFIVLKNSHNSFSFEFSAMHFSSPQQNQYKYMLEGFNEDWIEKDYDRRFANFSNLDPGDYVFKVMASNNYGFWNETPKELRIKILPPFWKAWWAYLMYVIFFVFLMWLFRRYILISVDYNNKLKIEKLEKRKLREINKMKLEFFTNISHEFKTPLTLILGPLQNLLEIKTTDLNTKESLLIMDRNAKHLYRLVNQLMDFRKAESKKLKVNAVFGDIVDFCENIVSSFHVLANKKHLDISFKSQVSELIAYFDHDLMEKIMNNILSNAVKFTPDNGSIRVSLSVVKPRRQMSGRPGQKNPEFQIIVEDSGIGIPKSKTSKIFGRFYQVDDANNVGYTGSGVGLALTKKLVVLLDGSIDVTSVENKGSRFVMSFPLIVDSPSIDGKIENILLEEGISEFKCNISDNSVSKDSELETEEKLPLMLIVEDNSDMQRFLKASFEGQYRIIQAFNGKQGLKKALDNIPNIIISDVMMPEMDGIEFCTKIKNNDITNHVPIIMLTAKGSVESKLKGLEVGADSYIPKPFDMRILEVKVKKLLEDRDILREKFRLKGITHDSKKIGINNTHKTFLEKAEKIIEENLMNNEFGVEDLALALSFSRMQLYRKFKSILGSSANEFIRNYRIKKAAHLLIETDLNVSEILYDVGFTNRSYFSKCFKQSFDMSPKEYAKKYRVNLKFQS